MKKMRLPVLFVSLLALLTSCSEPSMAGTYGFKMGKESGTHFGLFMELSSEAFEDEQVIHDHPEAKKAALSFDVASNTSETLGILINLASHLIEDESDNPDDGTMVVRGYYYKGSKVEKDGAIELKLGLDLTKIQSLIESISTALETEIPIPELNPDMIEKVVYTTYSGNSLTLNIPVSFSDVFYQLYWYGIDFDYNETDKIFTKESPYGKHEVGTHPTEEDVKNINQTFGADHQALKDYLEVDSSELNLSSYRDYHTLGMGLLKQ